jgi:VWFA-related protein
VSELVGSGLSLVERRCAAKGARRTRAAAGPASGQEQVQMRSGFLSHVCPYASALLIALVLASAPAKLRAQGVPGAGQTPSPQSSKPLQTLAPTEPLHVTARLVQINVIVNDKHGNPIPGLTKQDFTLLDNKKPQEIQVFSADTNLLAAQPFPALSLDTYTNRFDTNSGTGSSIDVILLDALNTESVDQVLTRNQVLKFLDQLPPRSRVALYWLGNGLHVLNDFTTDDSVLRRALASYKGGFSRELAHAEETDPALNNPNPSVPAGLASSQASVRGAFRSAFDERIANESVKNRVRLTLAALIAIGHHIGGLPGRKNLVWISSSFPLALGQDKFDLNWENDTGEDFKGQLARAAQSLADANVAIYPVDARGILGTSMTAAKDYADAPPPEFSGEGDEHLPSRVTPGNLETMKVLAERTGGRAFYGTNDLSDAIHRAFDDSRDTYTLGFYPPDNKWDGSFHSIKVSVKLPGARVRARTGYFAIPDSAQTPKSIQALIMQTVTSPLDATGISMGVTVRPTSAVDRQTMAIELHLDLRGIHMEQADGKYRGAVQAVFLQLSDVGEIIHATDETLEVSLSPASYDLALREGLRNSRRIDLEPGGGRLCIVLRDVSTGDIGSISIPLAKYAPQSPRAAH